MRLAESTPRSRVALTPMIDVVFLLLIFFMLAARFGVDGAVSIATAAGPTTSADIPRLVEVFPDRVALNGVVQSPTAVLDQLGGQRVDRSAPIVMRPRDGANVQRLIDVAEQLNRGGFDTLVLIE